MRLINHLSGKTGRITESGLARINQAWMNHDVGIMTAFRGFHDCGNGPVITDKENKGRNAILRSKLKSRGYGITKIKGSWFENGSEVEKGEASYFIVDLNDTGNLKKDLIKLGTQFEQDAIIFAKSGQEFIGISTNTCPESDPGRGRIGVEEVFGMPKFGKTGIYGFSRVGGRAFVFEGYDLTTISNHRPTEIRSIVNIEKNYPDKQSIIDIRELYNE